MRQKTDYTDPTLHQLIMRLKKFEASADVLKTLSSLEQLEDFNGDIDKISQLRKSLQSLLLSKDNLMESPELKDVTYDILLYLARKWPLNVEDPISLLDIKENEKIVLSTGHQFNIHTLIDYHNSRLYRGSGLGEQANNKWLLNPITNLPINLLDVRHIQKIAHSLGLEIRDLKTADSIYEQGKALVEDPLGSFIQGEALLREAANAGHPEAAFALAEIYFDSFADESTFRMGGPAWWGKKQDYQQGLKFLLLAAAGGHSIARAHYIYFLIEGKEELGILPNREQGIIYLDQLIKQDDLNAVLSKLDMLSHAQSSQATKTSVVDIEFDNHQKNLSQQKELDPSEIISQFDSFARRGASEAIVSLVKLYTDGDEDFGIKPDTKLASFYNELASNLENTKSAQVLELLEKASELGHAASSQQLAEMYLNGENYLFDDVKVAPDVDKALAFFQKSVSQGSIKAALELATIYLKKPLSSYDHNVVEPVELNALQAKVLLELALNSSDTDSEYEKANCAYLLAQIYLENLVSFETVSEKRDRVIELYQFAAQQHHSDAIAKLGALWSIGNNDLQVQPSPAAAQKFTKCRPIEAFYIAREIAAAGGNTRDHVIQYLNFYFRSIKPKILTVLNFYFIF